MHTSNIEPITRSDPDLNLARAMQPIQGQCMLC